MSGLINKIEFLMQHTNMATIKYEIRVPTQMYGYINILTEGMELEEVIEQHNLAVKLYEASKGEQPGLPNHLMCQLENSIINGKGIQEEDMVNMSPAQKYAFKRLQNTIIRNSN